MSDNLKIQIFKIIVAEKFRQMLKVCYFCYIICEKTARRQLRSFYMHCTCMIVQTLVLSVNQGLCHLCLVTNTTKIFQKLNLETKNPFSVRMEFMKLYDKKFLIYRNCMIRSLGQPGWM